MIITVTYPKLLLVLAFGLLNCLNASAKSADLSKHPAWILEAWTRDGTRSNVSPRKITLRFGKRELKGSSGVNSYSGKFSANNKGRFDLKGVAGTEMAGPPALMKLESVYLGLLTSMKTFSVSEDQLTLTDGTKNNQLHFTTPKPVQAKPLVGTIWTLHTFESGVGPAGAASSLIRNTSITLTIAPDGEATGSGGVNQYFGSVAVGKEGAVKFEAVGRTKKSGPPESMRQERTYFSTLREMTSQSIAGNQLTLSNRDGSKRLLFLSK